MADSGWKRFFIADGALRSPWRLLLYVALFLIFLAVGTLLGPSPRLGRGALLWQAIPLAAALGAGWLMLAMVDRRPPGALGFAWTSRTPRELGAGLAIGAASLAVIVVVLAAAGWLWYRPGVGTAADYTVTLVTDLALLGIAAAFEEALFRGYPFQVLVQAIGPVAATVLVSLAFALAHRENPEVSLLALVNIFLAGVMLSAAYLRTRSLWFATTVHVGWNWAMASLFDLPVSGLGFFDTPLYDPVQAGPGWVTGGAFGPEGGIGASVAFALALFAVLWFPGLDESAEMRAKRPLVDSRSGAWERRE